MILNTGGRTDTVQYYSDWLLNRFAEGYVLSRNPMFPDKITRINLDPSTVDCVVFCSKNYAPILPRLYEITDRFPVYCHYTITAYGRDVEPFVPSIEESVQTLKELSALVGKERIAWRYDPVLLWKDYTVERHLQTFERMAAELSPYIDRCIFSFVTMYKKLSCTWPELTPVSHENKLLLAEGMGKIAGRYHMTLQTCADNGDYLRFGIQKSGCMTLPILGKANHLEFRDLQHTGQRPECGCIETRDLGAYNTCPNGCRYCYANQSYDLAVKNFRLHDKEAPLLLGTVQSGDTVTDCIQKSFRKPKDSYKQLSLFDL